MRMLRYRQKLIKIRTMSKNSLQALALQAGVARRSRLFSNDGQQELSAANMSPAMQWQREHWLQLLPPLNQQVLEAMVWLKAASKDDVCVARLRTHPGIGLLTSLCLVHSLQPVNRFRNTLKVVAYAGFDPVERSSAERKRFLGISKAQLTLTASPNGGSGERGRQKRRGLKAFLPTSGRPSWAAQSQGGSRQKTSHSRLHYVAR
jgi:transposase